ncbi:MAG: dihydropteroate synthase [Ilumatobacteraceae bacterium]
MKLFGVLNASPDSLNTDSVVSDAASTQARIATLVEQDVWGFDLGGQGSTFQAEEVSVEVEWERLAPVLPELVATGRPSASTRGESRPPVGPWRPVRRG